MNIFAIETSCDETSASILRENKVLSNVISSQAFHSEFGGVVPELASRAQLEAIDLVASRAFEDSKVSASDIELVAATSGPGLIGSLLTGLNYAKAYALARDTKFIAVNHIEAHLYSCFIGQEEIEFPFIALVVSGGHTILAMVTGYFEYKILGQTQDDAAGEAFDKAAKMLGLGYPGGPLIDKAAKKGDENFHKFPVSKVRENIHDFSFSGVKTSLLYYLKSMLVSKDPPLPPFSKGGTSVPDSMLMREKSYLNNICASFQKAVIESLTEKVILAAENFGVKKIAVSGGVSANSKLRSELMKLTEKGFEVFFPAFEYTTDNAAMIGYAAYLKMRYGGMSKVELGNQIEEPAFARFK